VPFALQDRHTNEASLEAAVTATVAAIKGAAKPLWLGGPRLRKKGRREAFFAAAGAFWLRWGGGFGVGLGGGGGLMVVVLGLGGVVGVGGAMWGGGRFTRGCLCFECVGLCGRCDGNLER